MKKLLLLLFAVLFSANSYAQSNAIRVGVGWIPDNELDAYLVDFSVQYDKYLFTKENFFLSIGAQFNYDRGSNKGAEVSMMNLSIPLNFGKKFDLKNISLMPYVGFNGSYYTYGETKYAGKVSSFFDRSLGKSRYTPFQFGAQVGIDFVIDKVTFGFEGVFDLTKFHNDVDNRIKILMRGGIAF